MIVQKLRTSLHSTNLSQTKRWQEAHNNRKGTNDKAETFFFLSWRFLLLFRKSSKKIWTSGRGVVGPLTPRPRNFPPKSVLTNSDAAGHTVAVSCRATKAPKQTVKVAGCKHSHGSTGVPLQDPEMLQRQIESTDRHTETRSQHTHYSQPACQQLHSETLFSFFVGIV